MMNLLAKKYNGRTFYLPVVLTFSMPNGDRKPESFWSRLMGSAKSCSVWQCFIGRRRMMIPLGEFVRKPKIKWKKFGVAVVRRLKARARNYQYLQNCPWWTDSKFQVRCKPAWSHSFHDSPSSTFPMEYCTSASWITHPNATRPPDFSSPILNPNDW